MLKVSKMTNVPDVAVLQILASSNCVISPISPIRPVIPIAYMGRIGRMGRIEGEPMPGRLEMGRRLPDSGESGYSGTVHLSQAAVH